MKKYLVLVFFIFSSLLRASPPQVGADRLHLLLPLLQNKRVALVVNQTSRLQDGTYLLDTLLQSQIRITRVFAPEHGLRGNADAGESVADGKDKKTGLPITSLYGKNKKPNAEMLSNVDIVVFDIQDVGVRFYTYISTLHYVMEACAENNKQLIVLDRPNPNDFVDGPVLEKGFRSFVGMDKIPILYGLTVGELSKMINGEAWLKDGEKCDLHVIPVEGWVHGESYSLPVKPSPNLPNDQAVKLYPSLCFFESTNISVGRGTPFPFQVIGYPDPTFGKYSFTPKSLKGYDKNPLQKDKLCYGLDLRKAETSGGLSLKYLISSYQKVGIGDTFFKSPKFMDLLAGTDKLRTQIIQGLSEQEIRKTWEADLNAYKAIRKKYLLYKDN